MVLVGKKAREKKAKKEKDLLEVNSERDEGVHGTNKQITREHQRVNVVVCGDPKAVDIYMKQVKKIDFFGLFLENGIEHTSGSLSCVYRC